MNCIKCGNQFNPIGNRDEVCQLCYMKESESRIVEEGEQQYEDDCYEDDEDSEPIGSCENCGVNLYPGDDPELCDQCYQCEWWEDMAAE